ncbi:hypothetical protein D9M68_819440 [compost metagenome]
MSLSKRSMPSREGTGNCVTTSAATRLAASGWLFIEDSLEEGTLPCGCGGFGKVASCPEGWQAAMLDAVDRLSADVADSAVWLEILGPLCGPSRHKAAPTGIAPAFRN